MSDTDGYYTGDGADLQPGEQGEHIAELQERLIAIGFAELPTDGVFGESTQEALTTLAADRNLTEGTFVATVAQVAEDTGSTATGSRPGASCTAARRSRTGCDGRFTRKRASRSSPSTSPASTRTCLGGSLRSSFAVVRRGAG
jgi:peptidoglycan hydrolase-like protein with peptidoglycan-binding domain